MFLVTKPKNNYNNPFYIDLIKAFQKAGGKLYYNFSCVLESGVSPLWNNNIITHDNSVINSPVLKSFGFAYLKDIVNQGELISFQEIAHIWNIKNINAGRIIARIKEHLDCSLLNENRQGTAESHLQLFSDFGPK